MFRHRLPRSWSGFDQPATPGQPLAPRGFVAVPFHEMPPVMHNAVGARQQIYELAYLQAQRAAGLPGIDEGWFDI